MQLDPDIVNTIDPDHRDRFLAAIEHAIQTHGSFEVEVPNRWRDGTDHWLFVAGRVVDASCMVGVTRDITQRRTVEQALRASEEQYRAIVDAANEGIWRLDRDARIVFANDRMAELLGVTPERMIGRHKWDFVFDEDVPAMQALFERRKQGVSEEVADIRFRRGQAGEVWTLMSARPLYDEAGAFIGAVDLFTDITQRRRAEEELRQIDRRKDEFLAVLAHELRGPLAPIITAVKLLQAKGPTDPTLQKLRDTILRQTMQLSRLVDDLLDIGRITAGKLRLDKRRVDLRDIVRQAVEVATPLIERRRHTLRVRLPPEPVYVHADAARLVQVAANLLTNAAKYTPDGGSIEISLAEDDGVGAVCVRDQGVGIPPDMLGRVFDRFVQVATAGHRSEGGLGIGLSVVKALVELHGGCVQAQSDGIGKGSAFTFRVPLAVAVPVS
jgi:PAS domain S-box-containing protein